MTQPNGTLFTAKEICEKFKAAPATVYRILDKMCLKTENGFKKKQLL